MNEHTGEISFVPYNGFLHSLGGTGLNFSERERSISGKLLHSSFDVIANITKKYTDLKSFEVPVEILFKVKDVSNYYTTEDIMEYCALVGYRYNLLTDYEITFNEEV